MLSPVTFHHWDLEMGKLLQRNWGIIAPGTGSDLPTVAAWWTQSSRLWSNWMLTLPLLGQLIIMAGTQICFSLNEFLLRRKQVSVHLPTPSLFCSTAVTIYRTWYFPIILTSFIFLSDLDRKDFHAFCSPLLYLSQNSQDAEPVQEKKKPHWKWKLL